MSEASTRGRDPARTHANEAIEVRWEPRLCIHTQNCVRALGAVFDSRARPWVRVEPFCDGSHRDIGFTTEGST